MSNFLNKLISRELGQAVHAVTPRLPSRYEPQQQKVPFGMYEGISHHEPPRAEPGGEADPAEIQNPRRRSEEPIISKPRQQPGSASTAEQQRIENNANQSPVSAPTVAAAGSSVPVRTEEYKVTNTHADIDAERSSGIVISKPIHEPEVTTDREDRALARRFPWIEISEPTQSMKAPASRGAARTAPAIMETNDATSLAKASENSEPNEKTSLAVAIAPMPVTAQSAPTAEKIPVVPVKLAAVFPRSTRAESSLATPADEPLLMARREDKERSIKPRINPYTGSRYSRVLEDDVQHARHAADLMGNAPQYLSGQKSNAPASPGSLVASSSLWPASAVAPVRSQSAATVSSRRNSSAMPDAISLQPTINVSIGRIEVRAITQSPAPKRGNEAPKPMTLDEYLNKNNQRGR